MLTRRLSCGAVDGAGNPAMATDAPTYGEAGRFRLRLAGKTLYVYLPEQSLDMAYLDVKPEKPNGRTVVLMHGKNFCAGTGRHYPCALSQRLSGDRSRPDWLL